MKYRNLIKHIVSLMFFFFNITQLFSQADIIKFDHLSLEQGLSQNSVFCIIQDQKGFLWFGTEDGLNKYDGYEFMIYKNDLLNSESISDSYILSIHEDRSGILWIGTDGGGLNKFDKNKNRFVRYLKKSNNKNSISNNRIFSICEDPSGFLWIGTEGGLNKFDPKSETFIHYTHDPLNPNTLSSNIIHSIVIEKSGILWIGTDNGLNKFNPNKKKFFRYYAGRSGPFRLSSDTIQCIFLDSSEILWIGTDGGGLNKFDFKTGESSNYKTDPNNSKSISGNRIFSICEDSLGVLWIGTDGRGLNKFNREKEIFSKYQPRANDPYSLINNRVYSIYEDRSGILWFGTRGGGLSRFDHKKNRFMHYRWDPNVSNGLSHKSVWSFYEDRSEILWIGTLGGLNRFDRKKNVFTHYRNNPFDPFSLSHNYIRSICMDRYGFLWIGTDGGGLNKFDIKSGRFVRYQKKSGNPYGLSHNTIRPILEDHLGVLWIGTFGGGLNRFEKKTGRFIHYNHDPNNPDSISFNYIYCLYEDRSGALWIGTHGGGLNRFDRQKEKFVHYRHHSNDPNSLSHDTIYSILEDKNGVLWIGTRGGGLNKFDQSRKQFTQYTEKNGLPNDTIYGILEDDEGNLWVSTNKGISKFNPLKEEFKNYDVNDGLQSNEFNGGAYLKGKNGEIIFGGINGFNIFRPSEIKDNPNIPPVVITDFQIFNKSVQIGKLSNGRIVLDKSITESESVVLSYKDRVISFEFASLNFTAPEKNQYAYMMENFEDNWNYVNNRRYASYTNLPSGRYNFKVKASNCDGVWNEEGITLHILVKPPFWKTWWFYFLCGLMLTICVTGIYRYRVSRLKKRKEELEELVDERTQQLAESYKKLSDANKELEKLSIVASETENAIAILDKEGNFEWINESYTRMYEDTLDQLIKDYNSKFSSASSNTEINNIVNKCLNDKTSIAYEALTTNRSGKKIWAQTTLTPILNKDGDVIKLVAIDTDITKIKETEEQLADANLKLEKMAKMDGLTGIANYRRFEEFLNLEWRRSVRNVKPISIILIDVDFFKLYNDTYGHQVGDECLKKLGKVFENTVNRPTDLVARYGGEEFVIVLSETDSQGALSIAEKIRKRVEELKMIHKNSEVSEYITISLGCATTIPKLDTDPFSLSNEADKALYNSKRNGRNRTTSSPLSF